MNMKVVKRKEERSKANSYMDGVYERIMLFLHGGSNTKSSLDVTKCKRRRKAWTEPIFRA